jgi:hypothetical protein
MKPPRRIVFIAALDVLALAVVLAEIWIFAHA